MGIALSNNRSFESFQLDMNSRFQNFMDQNANIDHAQFFTTAPPDVSTRTFLEKGYGGVMGGPIGYNPSKVQIASGAIDIGRESGKLSGFVILQSETGTTDTLTDIDNFVFGYQDLTLLAFAGDVITITNTGNIDLDSDVTLEDSQAVTFFYDIISNSWKPKGSSGRGGGTTEPVILTVNTITPQTLPTTSVIDWSKNPNHITLDRDVEFSFDNLPVSGSYEGVLVIIDVDATGGYASPVWPGSITNPPVVPTTALTRTSVMLYTINGGTTVTHATSVGTVTGGDFANQQLDNLLVTAINADLNLNSGIDIIPAVTATSNIGTSAFWFSNVYTGTLNLGDATDNYTLSGLPSGAVLDVNGNAFLVEDGATSLLDISSSGTVLDVAGNTFLVKNGLSELMEVASNQVVIKDGLALGVENNIVFTEMTAPTGLTSAQIYQENLDTDQFVFNTGDGEDFRWDENGTELMRLIAGGALQIKFDADVSFTLWRDDSTPTASDTLGDVTFAGNNDNLDTVNFGRIVTSSPNITLGSEDGKMEFQIQDNSALTTVFSIDDDEMQIQGGFTFDVNGNRIDLDTDGDTSIRSSGDDLIMMEVSAIDVLSVGAAGQISWPISGVEHTINAGSASFDIDLDAATDIFTVQPGGITNFSVTQNTAYVSTNSITNNPILGLRNGDTTPTNGVLGGTILFEAVTSDASSLKPFGQIEMFLADATTASPLGYMSFEIATGASGALAEILSIRGGIDAVDDDMRIGVFGQLGGTQHSTTDQTAGFTAGSGTAANDDSTYTGGIGSKAYTVGDVVRALKQYGWMVSS